MITGTAGSIFRSSLQTSYPAVSGSVTSSRTTLGRDLLPAELGLEEAQAVPRVLGPGPGRRHAPEVEVGAAGLSRRGDRNPPGEVVPHQLAVGAGAAGEEAVGAPGVARHQDGGQGRALLRSSRRIRAAPWQDVEQQLVVTAARQLDGLAALHGRRLPCELGRFLALLDDDATLEPGADVVAPSVLEGCDQLVRWQQLDDARVLRLDGCHAPKSFFLQP